jgi:hypothetical protein
MSQRTQAADAPVRRYEYEDSTLVAADFGPAAADVSVDLVDGSAIVVVDAGDGEPVQREFDLPAGSAEAFNKNGVVTIEVSQ